MDAQTGESRMKTGELKMRTGGMKTRIGECKTRTGELKSRTGELNKCMLSWTSVFLAMFGALSQLARSQECSVMTSHPAPRYTDTILHGFAISHLYDFELMRCVLECFLVKWCASINYGERQGIELCTLSSAVVDDVGPDHLMNWTDFVYYDLQDWSGVLAGTCANRPCAENQRCQQTTPYRCVDVDCGPLHRGFITGVPPWQMASTALAGSTSLGGYAYYSCHNAWAKDWYRMDFFYTLGYRICGSDFNWSQASFGCTSVIRHCGDIKECNPAYGDGHYLIPAPNEPDLQFIVYCHNMTGIPANYLTLPPNQNIAQDTGTDTTPFSSTTFSRVRLTTNFYGDETADFRLDITDFITGDSGGSAGEDNHLGTAASCPSQGGSQTFKVDLTGTGFMLKQGTNWTVTPTSEYEVRNLTFTDTTVQGECGGTVCGRCFPEENIIPVVWYFNPTKAADGSKPTVSKCV